MRKIFRNIDKPLLLISVILFTYGLIMIFSASNVTSFMKYSASPYLYFLKQLFFLVAGLVASLFIINFHSRTYKMFSWAGILCIIALLLFLVLYGSVKNAAISWIDLGFFSLQPSEFAKLVIIIWISTYYETNIKKLDSNVTSLFPIAISMAIAFLIFMQPDLGTTIIFSVIVFSLFIMSQVSKEIKKNIFLLLFGAIAIMGVVVLVAGKDLVNSEQLQRFDFANPCSEAKFYTTGNQVCNGYIAINNGGLTGVGLGNSTQKYLYLPEAHTDFIFCIVMEETGLIGGVSILILMFLLLGRIVKIGKDSHTDRGAMICYGIAIYIFLHIFVNLGGILGLIPMTGVPLPFFSYGGSFTITLIIALSIVQRINIENKIFLEKQSK